MIQLANAPCSWGVLEFGLEGETGNYNTVLDEMTDTGYSGTELGDWGFMPSEPALLRNELTKRNLHLVGAFVPVDFINPAKHDEGLRLALKTAELLRNTDQEHAKIVLSDDNGQNKTRTSLAGRITPEHSMNSEEWAVYSQAVESIAKTVLNQTGVECVFHHHCAGFIETPDEIEELLNRTDPNYLNLCFDTGHYAFGGGNPVEGMEKYIDRITHVHFKDWDSAIYQEVVDNGLNYFEAVGKGIFCELGEGSVDFDAIMNTLRKYQYSGWVVVEQDILPGMGSPKASALRNRNYLKSVGL